MRNECKGACCRAQRNGNGVTAVAVALPVYGGMLPPYFLALSLAPCGQPARRTVRALCYPDTFDGERVDRWADQINTHVSPVCSLQLSAHANP